MLHLIEEKLESAPYQIEFIDTRIPEDQPLTCQSIVYIHKNGLMNEFESTLTVKSYQLKTGSSKQLATEG